MSNIRYNQASTTFSNVMAVGLLATLVLHNTPTQNTSEHCKDSFLRKAYSLGGNKPTFNSYSNAITGEYNPASVIGFEQSVSNFYAHLLGNQEPLGVEFERVLYDNLWDLYES